MGLRGREEASDSRSGTQLERDQLRDAYQDTIARVADDLIQLWAADEDKVAWAEDVSPGQATSVIRLIAPKMLEIRSAAQLFDLGRGRRHTSPEDARSLMEQSVQQAAEWYTTTSDHRSWVEDAEQALVRATAAE